MSDFLKEIAQYNIRRQWPTPDKCALLVIDMQAFFDQMASPILENVNTIIKACRFKGMPVIFTRHGHKDLSVDGGMLAQWWAEGIEYGSDDWHIINALSMMDTDIILDKNRYNAFHGTELDNILRSQNVAELIVTGVLTNCCCETTARDAFVRDYRVFFVSDATATVNDELHTASLKNLAFGFAHILSTKGVCDYLKGDSLP